MSAFDLSAFVAMAVSLSASITNGLDAFRQKGLLRLARIVVSVSCFWMSMTYFVVSAGLVEFGDASAALRRIALIPLFFVLAFMPMLQNKSGL